MGNTSPYKVLMKKCEDNNSKLVRLDLNPIFHDRDGKIKKKDTKLNELENITVEVGCFFHFHINDCWDAGYTITPEFTGEGWEKVVGVEIEGEPQEGFSNKLSPVSGGSSSRLYVIEGKEKGYVEVRITCSRSDEIVTFTITVN